MRARTRPGVPCNLIMFIIMYTFDDVNFTGLTRKKHIEVIGRQTNDEITHPGPCTATQRPPRGPNTCVVCESRKGFSHVLDLPQPHGAISRSRMNRPARNARFAIRML